MEAKAAAVTPILKALDSSGKRLGASIGTVLLILFVLNAVFAGPSQEEIIAEATRKAKEMQAQQMEQIKKEQQARVEQRQKELAAEKKQEELAAAKAAKAKKEKEEAERLAAIKPHLPTGGGYSPLGNLDIPNLVGKTVYVAVTREIKDDHYVYAGEQVTLTAAKPWDKENGITTYNYVAIKSKRGPVGEIQHIYLSKTPMKYDLTKPGDPETLIRNVLVDAYDVPVLKQKIDANPDQEPDHQHLSHAMGTYFEYASRLVHSLVYGTTNDEAGVLANRQLGWIEFTDDERFVSWLGRGIPDEDLKYRLRNAKFALSGISKVNDYHFYIEQKKREMKDKPWRYNLDHISEDKKKKLDAKEFKKREAEITDYREKMKKAISEAEVTKNNIQI